MGVLSKNKGRIMNNEEWAQKIEERLSKLELLSTHCSDPEDREIDAALRRALKTAINITWLLKNLTIFAGVIIAAKLAWDQLGEMLK